MRTFLGRGQTAPSRETAWGCLTTNLAFPGAGSIIAGKRVEGILQSAFTFAGFILTLLFGLRFIAWFMGNYSRLYQNPDADPIAVFTEVWSAVRLPLLGIGLFGLAWIWALLTSWRVLRESRKPPVL